MWEKKKKIGSEFSKMDVKKNLKIQFIQWYQNSSVLFNRYRVPYIPSLSCNDMICNVIKNFPFPTVVTSPIDIFFRVDDKRLDGNKSDHVNKIVDF